MAAQRGPFEGCPGRKTDVRDAEWIAQLLEHGLLSPSFVPPPEIRSLRMLTRDWVQLMGDRCQVAVAHSILVAAHHIISRYEPYKDLGPDWLTRRNDEAHTRRLVAQLERLGHTVTLDQAA